MAVKQLSVFIENKPGKLKDVISALSKADINIRAMNIADAKDYGILRLIVSDIDKAKAALTDDCLAAANDVIAVEMSDKTGSLADILNVLCGKGIDIDYLYAFTAHTERGACVVIRVADPAQAEALLKENGITVLDEAYIKSL